MKRTCIFLFILLSVTTIVFSDNTVSVTLTATGTMSSSVIDAALSAASLTKATVAEIKLLSATDDAYWNLADCQVISNHFTATGAPALTTLDLSAAAFEGKTTPVHSATGGGAFYGMGFSTVILPVDLDVLGDRTFMNCSKLTDITWPVNLKTISSAVFANCSALALTSLPESITLIRAYAFQNCTKLALTALPPRLEKIIGGSLTSKYTFSGTAISISSLPDAVTAVGQNTFQNCKNIRSMTFPAGFNQIGASAFASASNLTTLIFKGENTPYVENINAFSTPGAIDVIVPYGTPLDGASSWRRTPWTSFKSVTMASLSSGVDVPGATERNVAVYPSVATTEICLTGIDRMQTVCVYDITGQKVEEIEVAGNRENRISVARLIPGMYLLKTENTVLKFIKK